MLIRVKVLAEDDRLKQEAPYNMVKGLSRIEIAKNRFGPKGLSTWMEWDGEHTLFKDL